MFLTNWLKTLGARKRRGAPDYVILACFLFIIFFGLLMLSSASSDLGVRQHGDAWFFVKNQLSQGFLLGGLFFIVSYFMDYRILKKLAAPLLLLSIILLVLVFTPFGATEKGATRWIDLGFITVQPAEIVKLTFLIYIASWLSGRDGARRKKSFYEGLVPFLVVAGIISGLLYFQPATSVVAITMATGLLVYFFSGARMSYIMGIVLLGLLSLSVVIIITPYRFERLQTFIRSVGNDEVNYDLRGSRYHINQALITIGSGGWFGVGYGNSLTKTKYLPEPIGDSIFAVIAEEFGFVGGLIVVGVFLTIVIRGLLLARKIDDDFAKLLMIGLVSIIGIQAFVHMGAISEVLPLTGIPLPFVSYGSTALVIFLTMAGIILNLSRERR